MTEWQRNKGKREKKLPPAGSLCSMRGWTRPRQDPGTRSDSFMWVVEIQFLEPPPAASGAHMSGTLNWKQSQGPEPDIKHPRLRLRSRTAATAPVSALKAVILCTAWTCLRPCWLFCVDIHLFHRCWEGCPVTADYLCTLVCLFLDSILSPVPRDLGSWLQ